jgi:hypothetical protein
MQWRSMYSPLPFFDNITYRTCAVLTGPAAVTNIARAKLARREANILADVHIGKETIAQIITSEIRAIIMEARLVIPGKALH